MVAPRSRTLNLATQIKFQVYPRSRRPTPLVNQIADVFRAVAAVIATPQNQLPSNDVLEAVRPGLAALGFAVEVRGAGGQISVPVLFGENGAPDKSFRVDAWLEREGAIIEVEAGKAVDAGNVYKDLFSAAAIPEARFTCIAVMNAYNPSRRTRNAQNPIHDYDRARAILDTLFASTSFHLDLDVVMLLGY